MGKRSSKRFIFGECVYFLCSLKICFLKYPKTLALIENMLLSIVKFWMTVSPHDALSAPLDPQIAGGVEVAPQGASKRAM